MGEAGRGVRMGRSALFTNDQQTIPLHMRAVREYAARQGWRIAVIKELNSGAAHRELREQLLRAAA